MSEKQPTDHATKDGSYKFTVAGKSYRLPRVDEKAALAIPGDVSFQAVMNPDDEAAQLRLAFATLIACKPSDAAMSALRSLSTGEMLEHVNAWMGESRGSSD